MFYVLVQYCPYLFQTAFHLFETYDITIRSIISTSISLKCLSHLVSIGLSSVIHFRTPNSFTRPLVVLTKMFVEFNFVLLCAIASLARGEPRVAVAYLVSDNIEGTIFFTDVDGGVEVTGTITGLPAGQYGFHIHELGDISTCDAAGSHFNPDGNTHGGRDHEVRHVGDLGNIEFEGDGSGIARIDFVDNVISLSGYRNIVGRTLVLHADEDDLGLGGHEDSLSTGNAGARLACAVIGIKSPIDPWVQ